MASTSDYDTSSLLHLVRCNSVELVQQYLNHPWNTMTTSNSLPMTGFSAMDERDDHGRTPLHLATIRGADEIMRVLLHNGANVTAVDDFGNTPLHYAGHVETISCLFEHEADIFALNYNGDRPLTLLKRRGVEQEAVELLEKMESSEDMLEDEATEPLLRMKHRVNNMHRYESQNMHPIQSLWYEFYMGLGFQKLLLVLLIILCLSLYVAYVITGMSSERNTPVEVDITKVEL